MEPIEFIPVNFVTGDENPFDGPDPTEEDLKNPVFEAIWQTIKGWDVSPRSNGLYHGATGTQVKAILEAIRPFLKTNEDRRIDSIIKAVATYIDVYENSKNRLPRGVDALHSSLLPWLLAGNEPLPEAPPKIYSRPCHGLDAGQPVKIHKDEVSKIDPSWMDGTPWAGCDVNVAGDTRWKSVGDNLIRYMPNGHVYKVSYDDKTATLVRIDNSHLDHGHRHT